MGADASSSVAVAAGASKREVDEFGKEQVESSLALTPLREDPLLSGEGMTRRTRQYNVSADWHFIRNALRMTI